MVEGTLTFRLGERTVEAPAGTFVHIPKGVVHTHWNATDAPVQLLGFPAPAGFETFFADLAELMASMPPGPPDMSQMARFTRSTVCEWWGRLRRRSLHRGQAQSSKCERRRSRSR